MKITLKTAKPRNPFATLARSRHGGRHGRDGGAARQRAMRELQRDLTRMKSP